MCVCLCVHACVCACVRACVRVCVCVHVLSLVSLLIVPSSRQTYEDSIVIRSVFESARQRIVTDEEGKETPVTGSHGDAGGRVESFFIPSTCKSAQQLPPPIAINK